MEVLVGWNKSAAQILAIVSGSPVVASEIR